MEKEYQHGFKTDITARERKDIPTFSLLDALIKKFRLALILAAAGGCASYRLQNTATGFEPIREEMVTEEIPGEIVLDAKIEKGYLVVHTKRKIRKKMMKRITEQGFHYEYKETKSLTVQFIAAGVAGAIGAYNIFRARQRSEERDTPTSGFGSTNETIEPTNTTEDLSPDDQMGWGIGLASLGTLLAGHGTYVALRGMDSKEPTDQRHVDMPVSEDYVFRPLMCLIKLRAGDKHFLLDQTDDTGALHLTLEDLSAIIPQDQLVELLDGKEAFIKTEGAASVVVDLREIVPAEERIAYGEYKKLADRNEKIEAGNRFLEQYPLSFFAVEVKRQVEKLRKAELAETQERENCRNILGQAINEDGSEALEAFIDRYSNACIPESNEAMSIFCDRTWKTAALRPLERDFEKIRQFLATCPSYGPALKVQEETIKRIENSLCTSARKARDTKNLALAMQRVKDFQDRFGMEATCTDEVETAYKTADRREYDREVSAAKAKFEALKRRFRRGKVVTFNTRAVFETDDCFELLGFRKCYEVGYPVKYTGRVTEIDEDNFVIKIISIQLLEQNRESIKGIALKNRAVQALRGQIGQERGFAFQDIN